MRNLRIWYNEDNMTINYIAVIASAVVAFVVGFVWYGPLFGKQWMKLSGMTSESMKGMKMNPKQSMALAFLGTLVLAVVLDYFLMAMGVTDVLGAVKLAFWVWLGFFVTTLSGSVLWEGKSPKLYLFSIVYHLVSLAIIAAVLVLVG